MRMHKFLGFYSRKGGYLSAVISTSQEYIVEFKDECCEIYIKNGRKSVLFLTLEKLYSKKKRDYYYKCNVFNISFFLVRNPEPKKNQFDWFLYSGARGKRTQRINGVVSEYNITDFIFSAKIE